MVGSHSLQAPNSKEKESLLNSEFSFDDLSFSVADSFLNFEYIEDWIQDIPEPHESMASDSREGSLHLSSEKHEFFMSHGRSDMGSAESGDKIENEDDLVAERGGNAGLIGHLDQENVELVGIEKGSEMGCQSSSENIEVEDGVELISSGCLDEEKTEEVCFDGEMNDLVSAFGGMSRLKNGEHAGDVNGNKLSQEVIGGCDAAESIEVGSVNGNGVESWLVVGYGSEDARINETMILDDNGKKGDKNAGDGDEADKGSESESETQSSSSSSSESSSESESESESSSDNNDDEGDQKGKSEMRGRGRRMVNRNKNVEGETGDMEMEEGEIVSSEPEEMVAWSDGENDEGDGTGTGSIGPLRSKNELTVLPTVPPVSVTLQPHHQILPIGAVSSVIGAQIIVEGVEKHNPLNEGSILWITESGSPLGIVDEIFGPVKNPYYIVRYNSESEIPSGVQPGTSISFVPEFANHVLHDKSLYQKGYDASGANDEELSDDEEFSDDEKEAEYRKMLKNKKRGKNDEKVGNQRKDEKKFRDRSRNLINDPTNTFREPVEGPKQYVDSPLHHKPPPNLSLSQGNQSFPSCPGPSLACQPGSAPPPFAQLVSSSGFNAFSGVANGIPFQQPQSVGLPQMPPSGMPLLPQMLPPQLFQMPQGNRFPFQQQFNAAPNLPPNLVSPGCQPGFSAGPPFLPWPAGLGQNAFVASPFGIGGTPIPPASLAINLGQAAVPPPARSPIMPPASVPAASGGQEAPPSNILGSMYNHDSQQQTALSGKADTSQSFNPGKHYGGGRKQHRRGGGRFRGGGRGGRS